MNDTELAEAIAVGVELALESRRAKRRATTVEHLAAARERYRPRREARAAERAAMLAEDERLSEALDAAGFWEAETERERIDIEMAVRRAAAPSEPESRRPFGNPRSRTTLFFEELAAAPGAWRPWRLHCTERTLANGSTQWLRKSARLRGVSIETTVAWRPLSDGKVFDVFARLVVDELA